MDIHLGCTAYPPSPQNLHGGIDVQRAILACGGPLDAPEFVCTGTMFWGHVLQEALPEVVLRDLPDGIPPVIKVYGEKLVAVGQGKFPYECISKDKHPDAMIYMSDGGWTHEYDPATQKEIAKFNQGKSK